MRSAYKSCTVSSSACNPNFKQIHLSNQSVKIFPRTSPPQLGIPLSNAYTEFHYFDPRLHGFVSCSDSNRLCLFNCFVELAFPSFERIIMQSQCTTALPNNCNYPPKTSREISCPSSHSSFADSLQFSLTFSCLGQKQILHCFLPSLLLTTSIKRATLESQRSNN